MRYLVVALSLLGSPVAAQDLASQASQQASSPESAWSANLAPGMRNDFSQRFTAPPEAPRCPPGQIEARPSLRVGQSLTDPQAATCVLAPATPADSQLEVTKGKTAAPGAELKADKPPAP